MSNANETCFSGIETRYLEADGTRYAYRWTGASTGVLLLFLQRFGGTMDDWDPELLGILGAERPLLLFDNAGIGRSTGETAPTFTGIARGRASGAPANPDDAYLHLFFKDTPSGKAAGTAHLARLRSQPDYFAAPALLRSLAAQLAAREIVMTPEGSLLSKFSTLTMPVLVASGHDDIRIPTFYPLIAAQTLQNGKLILYPDSGHGFLFERAREFGQDALNFLLD